MCGGFPETDGTERKNLTPIIVKTNSTTTEQSRGFLFILIPIKHNMCRLMRNLLFAYANTKVQSSLELNPQLKTKSKSKFIQSRKSLQIKH